MPGDREVIAQAEHSAPVDTEYVDTKLIHVLAPGKLSTEHRALHMCTVCGRRARDTRQGTGRPAAARPHRNIRGRFFLVEM